MRIVHIVRQFYPAQGGIEEVVWNLARRQAARGHDVSVVTLNRIFNTDRLLPANEFANGFKIIRIRYWGSQRYPIAPGVLLHIKGAEILHVHAIDFFFDFLAITKILHRKKLVVSTHGGFFHTSYASKLKKLYFAFVTRYNITNYAFVAASSDQDLDIFHQIRKRGIKTIQNGVDFDKYANLQIQRNAKRIIYFGRFSPSKNIGTLFPFLRALRSLDPDWTLVIAGRPMEQSSASLIEEAKRFDCEDYVCIFESPTSDELRKKIATCSMFVSPSRYEGFGIAAVEATGAGLFPVLSDIAAHRLTVNATGIGLLVDFSEAEATAIQALKAWHAWQIQGERRKDFNKRLEYYSWEEAVDRFDDIYNKVTGQTERSIIGVPVRVTRQNETINLIDKAIADRTPLRIGFVNANLANHVCENKSLIEALQGFHLLNDGFGIDLASQMLYGKVFVENLNGTDFMPAFLTQTRHNLRLYLLGSSEDVVASCAEVFSHKWLRHQVVGFHHGFFSDAEEQAIAEKIVESRPDIVMVAMGNPRQEMWLAKHVPSVCSVGFAVGALFDFETNTIRRAPSFIRKARLEWIYRLFNEPYRLWRRYLIGNAVFLGRVALQLARGERL